MNNLSSNPENQNLHISVGVQPTNNFNLDNEIRMLKSGILYADKVKLYSPKVPAILAMSRFNDFPMGMRLEFFEKMIPLLSGRENVLKLSAALQDYRKIMNKEKLDIHELQFKNEFEKKLDQNWRAIAEQTNLAINGSQISQINTAMKAGVLELYQFKNLDTDSAALDLIIENAETASKTRGKELKAEQDKAWISEYLEHAVSDDSTYPLLDNHTGNLVTTGAGSKIFKIPGFGLEHGKQAELARFLLEQLPLFEKASVDEILDIRKELEKPLLRFRSAIIDYSDKIKYAPWDMDFLPEADKVYHRDVQPAMQELEDSIQSNKLLTIVFKKFAENTVVLPVTTSTVTMAISQLSELPRELATSLGAGIVSASILYKAYDEWIQNKKANEQNKLFFYYEVKNRLMQ